MGRTVVQVEAPSWSLLLCSGSSLLLAYCKYRLDIYMTYSALLAPLQVYLVLQVLGLLIRLYCLDTDSFAGPNTSQLIQSLVYWIYSLFRAVLNIIGIVLLDNYLNMPKEQQDDSTGFMFVLALIHLIAWGVYSAIINRYQPQTDSSLQSLYQSVMNAIFMLLGQSVTVCSGGACNSIYVSTLTSICSALGIPIVEWLPYVQKSVFLLLFFNIYTLWTVRRSLLYVPCLVTCCATLALAYDILVVHSTVVMVLANMAIIGAAILNMKTNPGEFKLTNKKLKLPI